MKTVRSTVLKIIAKHILNPFLISKLNKDSSNGIINFETKYAHFHNRRMFYGDEIKLKLTKIKKPSFKSFEKFYLRNI